MKLKRIINQKSQLKIGETIFVLLIFFIMITIGAVFYFKIQTISSYDDLQKQLEVRTIKIAEQIKSMPELVCTQSAIEEYDCIDKIKYLKFAEFMKDKNKNRYYSQVFTNVNIGITEIYPTNTKVPTKLFSNLAIKEGKKSVSTIFLPVTIYDAITNQNSFGIITVEIVQSNQ